MIVVCCRVVAADPVVVFVCWDVLHVIPGFVCRISWSINW